MIFFVCGEENTWSGNVVTDFAYYPKSAYVTGDLHFAPITGPFSGVEGRVTGNIQYKIPTPFGDNPLVSGNSFRIGGFLEFSPVSLASGFSFSFSPIAFLDFSAGASMGTGWDFIGLHGMATYNPVSKEYDVITPFTAYRYDLWAQGLFQFDLAALVPGEWNHVVTVASFKIQNIGLTKGSADGNPWMYQTIGEQVNGLKYYSSIILGYQMPLLLQTIGVQTEFEGYFDSDNYNEAYSAMKGDFCKISISPVAILEFSPTDSLIIQPSFSSRRSFSETQSIAAQGLLLTYAGREWFFNRLALRYTHKF
jgi:hypothetical protein